MMEKSPRFEEWQKLFEFMIELKEIAPWKWMVEQDIFAVQHPETNELGFVSVMGYVGEHYAISVYLGDNGLYGFWDLQQNAPDISPELFFKIPQLQASFEDRDFLRPEDRDLIKQLGLHFQGKQFWPMFRSYRPGFFPWYLESDEARFLSYALQQTIEVSMRFKKDRSLLKFADEEQYLVRMPVKRKDKMVWRDSLKNIPPPESYSIELTMNAFAIQSLKNIVPSNCTLEIDLFMSPSPCQDKGERPYYPYILMMIDADSGMILGNEVLQPIPNLETMWGTVPKKVTERLVKVHLLPQKILINSEFLLQLLNPLSDELGFSLEISEILPNLDEARASMLKFLA
ncbi:MAG: hypothetical protein JSW07_10160 [bacterium]|nr:MAG: hypothetical protein JSW07_10160 [bacterium]